MSEDIKRGVKIELHASFTSLVPLVRCRSSYSVANSFLTTEKNKRNYVPELTDKHFFFHINAVDLLR